MPIELMGSRQHSAVEDISTSLKEYGAVCFNVGRNATEAVQMANQVGRRIFGLTANEKKRISVVNSPSFLGYSSRERLEKYDIIMGKDCVSPLNEIDRLLAGPNLYPEGEQEVVEAFGERLEQIADAAMAAVVKSRGLSPEISDGVRRDRIRFVRSYGGEPIGTEMPFKSLLQVHLLGSDALLQTMKDGVISHVGVRSGSVILTLSSPMLNARSSPEMRV
jgi:hypothetical protein